MRKEKSRFIASVAVSLIAAALVVAPSAWAASTYKILHAFRKSSGGQGPVGNLVSDAAGNLYGTNYYGGLSCSCGVVFKLAHNSDGSWTEHVLHRFTGGADGNTPTSELILDAAGNLYGTTNYGGLFGRGVVFKLAPNPDGMWTEQVLYAFMGGTDGSIGSAGMIFDAAGNLYGTNYYGGGLSSCDCGVVFKLAPNPDGTWTEHVLYRFAGGITDGANPRAGVILDAAGNLYGTTELGGLGWSGGSGGWGTVFELMPNPDGTWTEHVLYRFTGGIDGATPFAGGVILDAAGNLYGTTRGGGSGGWGTVFELTPSSGGWTESVLHSFTSGADGSYAVGWLSLDATGNLYGTTEFGGVGYGVVFELTRASGGWKERVLHAFLGYGANPSAGLIRGASGNLYGTAAGGTSHGLVWQIKP